MEPDSTIVSSLSTAQLCFRWANLSDQEAAEVLEILGRPDLQELACISQQEFDDALSSWRVEETRVPTAAQFARARRGWMAARKAAGLSFFPASASSLPELHQNCRESHIRSKEDHMANIVDVLLSDAQLWTDLRNWVEQQMVTGDAAASSNATPVTRIGFREMLGALMRRALEREAINSPSFKALLQSGPGETSPHHRRTGAVGVVQGMSPVRLRKRDLMASEIICDDHTRHKRQRTELRSNSGGFLPLPELLQTSIMKGLQLTERAYLSMLSYSAFCLVRQPRAWEPLQLDAKTCMAMVNHASFLRRELRFRWSFEQLGGFMNVSHFDMDMTSLIDGEVPDSLDRRKMARFMLQLPKLQSWSLKYSMANAVDSFIELDITGIMRVGRWASVSIRLEEEASLLAMYGFRQGERPHIDVKEVETMNEKVAGPRLANQRPLRQEEALFLMECPFMFKAADKDEFRSRHTSIRLTGSGIRESYKARLRALQSINVGRSESSQSYFSAIRNFAWDPVLQILPS
eukprot:TRINITY_DN22227_c0_g1_i2.p1 TRINITY_DN22227_c0_g1~~TRINITY_DN22227_c0_g1_i2.p1  ORF type:complete len:520 (-),score=63.78 TRINITY_DN22227_c0_g1_i2:154-1713(-)